MAPKYESLIEELATTVLGNCAFNQYAAHQDENIGPANAIRRQNLRHYLDEMFLFQSHILLVGEAAGYRGCRLTGVPFTSEKILLEGISPIKPVADEGKPMGDHLFGHNRGYRKTNDREKITREATATIIWGVLVNYWPPPLLWNAYPFHPHQAGKSSSNRPPARSELEIGCKFLKELMSSFDIKKVVAVGNKASQTLSYLGISAQKVRHPSHGGKHHFTAGIHTILDTA